MRVRLALTLVTLVVLGLLASPTHAQAPAPEPAPIPDGHALRVARPRTAVLSVFHSAAESFLLPAANSADSPIRLEPPAAKLRLHADYEALFLPLTAGWSRYHLAVYLLAEDGRELLAEDAAQVVDFGPSRHRGRLVLDLALRPGLHRLSLVAKTEARAVGVSEWTRDEDQREIWVYVPGAVAGVRPDAAIRGELSSEAFSPAQSATDPALPVGGLAAGSQRGVLGTLHGGAINFETPPATEILARVDQTIPVWSDYELWWSERTEGDASASLSVYPRRIDGTADRAAVASDRFGLNDVTGPRLEDGNLDLSLSFDRAGTYALVAVLETQVRIGDLVIVDRDNVPFTVKVVGDPPTVGSIAGTVYGGDGLLLEGVVLEARDANGAVAGRARSNAGGAYRIDDLEPGRYLVHALPGDLNYLDQWFDGKASMRLADSVTVERGQTTPHIDFKLTPGGTITGRVTDASGQPLGGIEITAGLLADSNVPGTPAEPRDPATGFVAGHRARTNDDGYYSIHQLPAGRYWVRARDPQGKYLTEYFDDKPGLREADPVGVSAGKVSDGIDFELASGGAIGGQVRQETQLTVIIPLAGKRVEARHVDNPDAVVAATESGRDGRYKLGGLREGRYLVRASDPTGKHLAEWYLEAATPADAEPVPVVAGRTTEEINFTLSQTPARTLIFIDPAQSGVSQGASGRVGVAVADVENLGSFEVELRWNPQVLRVDGVELGNFLGSTGREVIPVEPEIDNREGRLRYAAASIGRADGPSGEGLLFQVGFTGLTIGESALLPTDSIMTTPNAEPIEHGRRGGMVKVGSCMFGDFDCNCRIDIRDVMAVVVRWGSMEGDPDYDKTFDLDADGDIDIVDVQIVAGLWGKTCAVDPNEPGTGFAAPERSTWLDGSPSAPDAASLRLTATPVTAQVGQTVEIGVYVDEAAELAGFEASLAYDPNLMVFVDGQLDDFLGSTGRTVVPLGPLEGAGKVTIGGGSLPGKPAPSGSGRLATLRFEILAAGSVAIQVDEAITVDAEQHSTEVAGTGVVVEARPSAAIDSAFVPLLMTRR